ncbi:MULTISPECIES: tripartite tricarboxylate transporter substrate binding protein [unclassified Paenibacillus]|uniref:tripartite tricarboxylate transporter substrate binding protein n=1 Tax=unclassified Paenibacillus TaxID=185978 RepID=UPI001AE9530B|nr:MULTISPECIES: tripartite tricarboxylate transporter substrate binding protein [unclassified Paenibacillus]MBP1154525.1 tripartite-type tricarboxylate transporter receptor subunit TctC [Paenibacillus sp. PvP091]MBP1170091.1 tripartite-type tricarboxylate transporter receptor subunit TctC [Paenibacillus sp. PvR098]MBP2441119.1 tripartite-type tricarboxylate transporter receptor subunit TctC [Paenibacillus sp. PvP052]
MISKKSASILVASVFGLQVLTGCGTSATESQGQGASPAAAEKPAVDFPTKSVTIVVHTKAGGPTDTMARELAKAAEPLLGKTVMIENQPGGSGASQMAELAKAKPDGYTLGTLTPSQIGMWNSNLKEQFKVDSYSYVSGVQIDPYVIAVHSESPYKTLQDLVDAMKAKPKTINVGGYGAIGSGHNVAWNIFAEKAGVQANWVPYESTGEAVTVLLGKNIDVANSNPAQVSQYVKSGQLRVLAVMAEERLPEFPDVPTYKEAGYEVDTSWAQFRGIYAPAGIPEEVLQKLNDVFGEAMQTEGFKNYMKSAQMVDGAMDHKQFTEYVNKQNNLTKEWLEKLK